MKQLHCKSCGWEAEPDTACPNWCPKCNQPLYIREIVDKSPKSVILPYIQSVLEQTETLIPNYKLIALPNCCIMCQHWSYEHYWCIKHNQETEFNGLCEDYLAYEDILP